MTVAAKHAYVAELLAHRRKRESYLGGITGVKTRSARFSINANVDRTSPSYAETVQAAVVPLSFHELTLTSSSNP